MSSESLETSSSELLQYLGMIVCLPHGELLADAMKRPQTGSAHRPKRIVLRGHPQWRELFPHLKEIGVEVFVENDLYQIEAAFNDYLRFVQNSASKNSPMHPPNKWLLRGCFPLLPNG